MAQLNGVNGALPVQVQVPADKDSPRKMKILMLHGISPFPSSHNSKADNAPPGYTQSGALFHAKTRSLEKLLLKSFPAKPTSPLYATYPGGITLTYPTAPIRLLPADIPGADLQSDKDSDAWGWWKRETGSGRYAGLEEGLDAIARAIREMGGVDGVIGFSQGAAAAGFVASLLESGRRDSFAAVQKGDPEAFRYPLSWEGLEELCPGGVRFAVCYSGFATPSDIYRGFYEPRVKVPALHFIGSLDSVVEESRSLALVEATENGRTVYHPGGHFVPVGKDMGGVLVGFIRECCEIKKEDESVEDMDVPF